MDGVTRAKAFGIANLVIAGFDLMYLFSGLMGLVWIGFFLERPAGIWEQTMLLWGLYSLVAAVVLTVHVLAGVGFLRRRRWASRLNLIGAVLAVPGFIPPLGLVFAILAFLFARGPDFRRALH